MKKEIFKIIDSRIRMAKQDIWVIDKVTIDEIKECLIEELEEVKRRVGVFLDERNH